MLVAEADKKIRRLKDLCAGHTEKAMLTPLEQLTLFGEVSGEIVDVKDREIGRTIPAK